MKKLTYYRDRGPYPVIGGRPSLAGLMREFLDGIHGILDLKKGGVKIDGALAQQIQPANVLKAIGDIATNAGLFMNGVPIDPGYTAGSLMVLYLREARTLLAAYK